MSGHPVVVVRAGVQVRCGSELFQNAGAFDLLRGFPRLVQRGQEHRGQNGDDRNHDQKLNQSESVLFQFSFLLRVVKLLVKERLMR